MSMYYTVIVRHQRWYFLPSVHKHMQMKGFSLSVQSGWCKTTPQRLYGEKSCYWLIIQSTFSFFEPQDGSSWDFLNIIQIKMSGAYLFWSGQDAFLCWNFEMGNAKATRLTYIGASFMERFIINMKYHVTGCDYPFTNIFSYSASITILKLAVKHLIHCHFNLHSKIIWYEPDKLIWSTHSSIRIL